MTTTERDTAVGVFQADAQARHAVNDLEEMGFTADQLGYAGHDGDGVAEDLARDVAGGAATGAVGGAVAGGVLGALAAGLLPGVGPMLGGGVLTAAAGILTSTAVGAGAGAAAAGLKGALTGLGVSEEDAQYYEGEFKAGRSLVAVKAAGRYDEVRTRLRGLGAYDIENRAA